MSSYHEEGSPEGYRVAQTGEFRYMVPEIQDYRVRITRNRYEMGLKLIVNGRFPTGDLLPDYQQIVEKEPAPVLIILFLVSVRRDQNPPG